MIPKAIRPSFVRPVGREFKRGAADLITLPKRPPAIAHGPPGRSAISGHTVTVFGCGGFLGRYLVAKLAKSGTQTIVPFRDDYQIRHLRVSGDLGVVVQMEWDLRNPEQIAECLRHSDTVYNLVGLDYETKNFKWNDVHVDGAARIAKIAAENNVSRFVHVSHLNASVDSKSAYYRYKATGEQKVQEAFPGAVIVRPGTMFGHEDKFLNQMAYWPVAYKFNGEQTKVRPVHVNDVAEALYRLLRVQDLPPSPINLPGPKTYTYEELLELVRRLTLNPLRGPAIPKPIAQFLAKITQYALWWPTMSPDEIERRYIDDSMVAGDWEELGISPTELEEVAITYLRRFRDAARVNFSGPVETAAARHKRATYYTEEY